MEVLENEKAKRLAKEVATQVAPSSPIPFHDMYSTIWVVVFANWQNRWKALVATTKMGETASFAFRP